MAQLAPETRIRCHGLAVAKAHDGSYETVVITDNKGHRAEHLKLAQVAGTKWIVHPGTSLATSLMFMTEIANDAESTPHKRPRERMKPVIVDKIEPIKDVEALSKLFATAQLLAEVKRASIDKREVDVSVAHALFDKSSHHTKMPKRVYVLWNAANDGGVEEHANEVAFKTLFHKHF